MTHKFPSQALCLFVLLPLVSVALVSCKNSSSGGSDGPGCSADECKLTASDAEVGALFGRGVAVAGDTLAVAAPEDDEAASGAGAVYVFARDGFHWNEVQKLLADDASAYQRLGGAISLDGDLLVAAARSDGDNGDQAGAVYVFRRSGNVWAQEQKLLASDGEAGDAFGAAVSASGDVIAVGAPGDDDGGSSAGAVYVFRFGGATWTEEQKLTASDAGAGDEFGLSVATDGTVLSAGSPRDATNDSGSGYVFRFDGMTWNEESKVVAQRAPLACQSPGPKPDSSANALFGSATAIDGDLAAFGGPYSDFREQPGGSGGACQLNRILSDSGAIYLYRYDGVSSWVFESRLEVAEPTAVLLVGSNIALDNAGGTVVGGAPGAKDNGTESGAGYVFRYDAMTMEWSYDAEILPSDGVSLDVFGTSAALDGTTAVFGATGDDDDGPLSGSAYVYPL